MYKNTSNNSQRIGRTGVLKLKCGEQNLTAEQKVENLKARLKQLHEDRCIASGIDKHNIGINIQVICQELSILKKLVKAKKIRAEGFEHYFIRAAKKILPKFKYEEVFAVACAFQDEDLKIAQKLEEEGNVAFVE